MSTKAKVIIAIILVLGVIGGFLITARDALFGDVPFSEINLLVYFTTTLIPIAFILFVFFVASKGAKKKEDDEER